jgi:hypothetical protein
VTFFEYLRALITADYDLVRNDRFNYRVAFVEAFRRRGVSPDMGYGRSSGTPRTLSVETLRWQGIDQIEVPKSHRATSGRLYAGIVEDLKRYADACTYFKSREELFTETRKQRAVLQRRLKAAFAELPRFAHELGLDPERNFELHDLRRAMRSSPGGGVSPQVIVALTQSVPVDGDPDEGTPAYTFRGGSTLVVDLTVPEVKYRIVKRVQSEDRRDRTEAYIRELTGDPLRALFFGPNVREPFAALHALGEEGAGGS